MNLVLSKTKSDDCFGCFFAQGDCDECGICNEECNCGCFLQDKQPQLWLNSPCRKNRSIYILEEDK